MCRLTHGGRPFFLKRGDIMNGSFTHTCTFCMHKFVRHNCRNNENIPTKKFKETTKVYLYSSHSTWINLTCLLYTSLLYRASSTFIYIKSLKLASSNVNIIYKMFVYFRFNQLLRSKIKQLSPLNHEHTFVV